MKPNPAAVWLALRAFTSSAIAWTNLARFYWVDASRREGHTLNAGLGLAITKSIMGIHGGTVSGESREGLTRFTLTFPRPRPAGELERQGAGNPPGGEDKVPA